MPFGIAVTTAAAPQKTISPPLRSRSRSSCLEAAVAPFETLTARRAAAFFSPAVCASACSVVAS